MLDTSLTVIVFKMNEQYFAVEIENVRSIERALHITDVPDAPRFLKGICHIQGNVIPVIELKERLSFGTTTYDDTTRYLVVQLYETQLALVVDDACDVLELSTDIIQEVPNVSQFIDHDFVKHVAKVDDELIIILQLEQIFQEAEVELFANV